MGNTTSHQQIPYHKVHKLPLEILAEILWEACEEYKFHIRNSLHDGSIPKTDSFGRPQQGFFIIKHEKKYDKITPGTLCLVSRAWRDVVYSIPDIWDTMIIRAPVGSGQNVDNDQVLANMKLWLKRAGSRPLTVKIDASQHLSIDLQLLLIDELIAHSDQWKSIDIPSPGCKSKQFSALQKIMENPPVTLRGFTIRPSVNCLHKPNGPDQQHTPIRISKTRHLTRLTKFRDFPLTVSPTNIKACTWSSWEALQVVDDLKHMAKLVECSIVMENQRPSAVPPTISKPLPPFTFLQRLSLQHMTNHAVESILPTLELPALRHLDYSHNNSGWSEYYLRDGSVVKPILSLLQRSNSPYVESLELEVMLNVYFDEEDLLEIFRIVPNLEHFKFIVQGWDRSMPSMDHPKVVSDFVCLNYLTTYYADLHRMPFAGNKALLHRLTLPALQEFQVILPTARTPSFFLSDLQDLVKRSNCPLKNLKINTSIIIPNKSLQSLLMDLPSLECLHIIGQYNLGTPDTKQFQLTYSVFETLFIEDDAVYLPNLSELSLEGILANGFSWDYAFDALESRWEADESKNVARLRRVRIYPSHCDAEDSEVQQRVISLREKGMDITVQRPEWHDDWDGTRY